MQSASPAETTMISRTLGSARVLPLRKSRLTFNYRLTPTFQDSNLVGNIYYVHHISWQGRCRELFLKEHAPGVLSELARDLRLVTLRVTCDYYDELHVFDEIEIRMSLAHLRQHKIGLDFEYCVGVDKTEKVMARGFQEVGCMRLRDDRLVPSQPPAELSKALQPFMNGM